MKYLSHIGVVKDKDLSSKLTRLGIEINSSRNRLNILKYEYGLIFNINNELPIDYFELGAIREVFNKEVLIYRTLKKQYREMYKS